MSVDSRVTAVIVNYQTPDLLRTAAISLRRSYPRLALLIIDNGSKDGSRQVIEAIEAEAPDVVRSLFNDANLHHGPAMDQALRTAATPFVLFLDSDCEVLHGGFVEEMLALLDESAERYVVGKRIYMDHRGFDLPGDECGATAYIRPLCMLVRRDLYMTLPPFYRHGTPCLENMTEARRKGYGLIDFPVERFIEHKGRGTASRHGYRLGIRGKWNHLLHKLGL